MTNPREILIFSEEGNLTSHWAITVYACACVLAWVLLETDGTLKLESLGSI